VVIFPRRDQDEGLASFVLSYISASGTDIPSEGINSMSEKDLYSSNSQWPELLILKASIFSEVVSIRIYSFTI
jgi:hypothetical protein